MNKADSSHFLNLFQMVDKKTGLEQVNSGKSAEGLSVKKAFLQTINKCRNSLLAKIISVVSVVSPMAGCSEKNNLDVSFMPAAEAAEAPKKYGYIIDEATRKQIVEITSSNKVTPESAKLYGLKAGSVQIFPPNNQKESAVVFKDKMAPNEIVVDFSQASDKVSVEWLGDIIARAGIRDNTGGGSGEMFVKAKLMKEPQDLTDCDDPKVAPTDEAWDACDDANYEKEFSHPTRLGLIESTAGLVKSERELQTTKDEFSRLAGVKK